MSTTFLTSISNTEKKKSSSGKIDLPKHYKFSTSPKSNGDNKIFANMHEKLAMFASESVSTQLIRKRKELGEAESTLSDIRQVSTKKLESLDQRNTSFRRKKREIRSFPLDLQSTTYLLVSRLTPSRTWHSAVESHHHAPTHTVTVHAYTPPRSSGHRTRRAPLPRGQLVRRSPPP